MDESSEEPPRWLRAAVVISAGGVCTFGSAGLFLALNNRYSAGLALLFGALGLVGITVLVLPVIRARERPSPSAHWIALLGVGLILVITVWNCANASQHVLINRDGGAYIEEGRWLARDGSLEISPRVGPFKDVSELRYASPAIFPTKAGTLQFQFAHLLPALLAQGYAVGGDRGLFLLPPLLGGVALLAFFVLAWRVLRQPAFALIATLALGLLLPQVAFARDAYSEIPSQVLLFGALGLLVGARGLPHWRAALVAGLLLGTMQATRADAPIVLAGIPFVALVAWLRATRGEQRRALVAPIVALFVGVLPGFVLGLVDLINHSRGYWHLLGHDEGLVLSGLAASVIGCGVVAATWRYIAPRLRGLPWNPISWSVAAIVVAIGLGAWFVRPYVQSIHKQSIVVLQQHGHLVPSGVTMKYEGSMAWMSWYLGPVTLLAAIVAAGLLARALLRGRYHRAVAPLALLVPGTLLYLWYASAYADHIWVTRRYLDSAFPLFILLAVGLAAGLWKTHAPRWERPGRVASASIALLAVAFPAYTVAPVASTHEQAGYLAVIKQACRILGPRPAVVVLEGAVVFSDDVLEGWLPQALRGWCGADVAILAIDLSSAKNLSALAGAWNARGRRFFVVASGPAPIHQVTPGARLFTTRQAVDRRFLEQSLTGRPRRYVTETFSLALGEVRGS